jgi:hypothetical protein
MEVFAESLPQLDYFGTYVDTSVASIVEILRKYVGLTFKERKAASLIVRERVRSSS